MGYVLNSYPVLSQTFVVNEIAELRRQGRRVVIVALNGGDGVPADGIDLRVLRRDRGTRPLAKRLGDAALRAKIASRQMGELRHSASLRSDFNDSTYDPWTVVQIANHFRSRGVGWIHTHFAWAGAAHALAAADLLGVPVSMTVHARDIFVPKRDLVAKLARAEQLVSVCAYNDAWMDEHGLPRPATTRVVCGVRTVPAPQVAPERDLIVVGRLVAKKGIDLVLRALPSLLADRPGLRLTVVGEGPERSALEALSSDLGIEHAVTFAGALPHEQTLDMIASSRLLLLPTRIAADGDRDSMPVVVKEAMMRRVPVVGTDVVAMSEMVDDAVGVLVASEDIGALASAIAELLSDEARRLEMGEAARARAIERFSLEANVAVLDAIWAEHLAQRPAAPPRARRQQETRG